MAGRPAVLKVDIIADAKGASKGVAEAESRFAKLGGAVSKAGKVAALGGAAVAAAAAAMAVASVKAASDLEQSMGAVETVFGKAAGTVKKYAKDAATSVGLSTGAYAQLAASVGTSLKQLGESQEDTALMTDELIGRAADLASVFGGDAATAVESLGSAFRGEFDSIEKYGLNIKASDVSARLAADGQSKLKGEALKTAEAWATYDLIMEKSKGSTGAFTRETDTLAHQQQVLTAQFDNAKAAIGARFIPALLKLAKWFQESVLPAAKRVSDQLRTQLAPAAQRVGEWVSTRLVPALRGLADYVMQKVVPIIRSYLTPILQGVLGAFKSLGSSVGRNADQFAKLKPVIDLVVKAAKIAAPIIGRHLKVQFDILGRVLGFVVDVLGAIIGAVDAVIRKFDDMARKVGDVVGGIKDKVGSVGDLIGKLPGFSADVTVVGPQLATVGPSLTGPGYRSPDLGPLTTFAAGSGGVSYSVLGGGAAREAFASANVVNITVNGAIDPPAVARQIGELLRAQGVRLGRTPAFSGWLS